ncbi:hypothetical protein ACQ4PT_029357 [Festuca glaucescens]
MESTVLSLGKSMLSRALGYASSAVAQEVALQLGIQGDHSFITDELEMMQAFLMTAHEDQQDNKVVKTWVKQVREVAYDVEDCLQDFAVRLENLSWWHIPFRLLDRRHVAEEMKELRFKVEDVSQRNLRYRLIEGSCSKPTATAERSTISTEVLLHIAEATRRTALQQNKKVDLVKLITEDADDLGVIAVWAASSDVGVTSIIRAAYDDKNVKVKFQCRAWVRLMHPFNPRDFFISLVRQFYMHSCEETGKATEGTTTGMEVTKKMAAQDNLVDEFNRYVTQTSYLVIINDVSSIEEWDWIKTYFPSKSGSRIIVSTQKFEVASLCTKQPHTVSEIDQKWSFDKDFYVFYYRKVDTLIKEDDKAKPSSIEPAGEEHVNNPTHATTVAAASEEDELIDRKAAKNKVIRLIDQRGYVITNCGMGGIGKTTLVRDLYQQELGEMFQRHAWLTMSRSFEHQEFLRELFRKLRREDTKKDGKLHSASSEKEHKSKEKKKQILFEKLAKILLEQKCLIVLDDLSSTVELQWVLDLLPVNTPNRIVVTTRELDIAKCCSLEEEQIYNLELLDCKESNLLFAKKVFKNIREKENFDHNPDMIEQANLVLKKCGGLPLAISIVGSFLATKPKTSMEWRNLNTHISAELESNPELGMIKTVLTSSYDELRKLRVTGLNKKNCRKFFSAIANHKCLESLSMRSEGKPGFFGCLGDPSSLHISLQSLELYGNLVEMPKWIDGLKNLVKLVLRSSRISEHDVAMQVLGKLPNLAILRLLWHSFEGEEVCFSFHPGAFRSLMVLELGVQDNLQSVKFKAGANPKLELLVFSCRPEDANIGLFSGLPSLTSLKEFMLDSDNYKIEFMENLRNQLARNSNGPVLKRYNYNS